MNGADVANIAAELVIDATISGTGPLTKAGGGTLMLSGSNSYTGPTQIAAGAVDVASDTAFGTAANTLRLVRPLRIRSGCFAGGR